MDKDVMQNGYYWEISVKLSKIYGRHILSFISCKPSRSIKSFNAWQATTVYVQLVVKKIVQL